MRDPRFDILFEPVKIGPHIARNRFYQTPHCNGMGNLRPQAHARMRGIKAEGGWAVVNTEHCSVHPTGDLMPEVLQMLWDDGDIPPLALMCDAVHEHGSLAGVQLAYPANYNGNRLTREVPLGPMDRPVSGYHPVQVRAMDKSDIRNLRDWWKAAAIRARKAGFDIINVDSNFSTIAFQFLSPRNQRSDEYGGSLANRVRLLKELIEVSREGAGEGVAISVRLIVDELFGDQGLRVADEGIEAISMLAELPDLWDLVVGTWADDSPTSRFAPENDHEPFMLGIKSVTTKPVIGVGRFTSPDTMASLVRRGVLDMIGAARPSIADPFLPKKIEEGRYEDIRECIGCNICVSSHFAMVNLRCTQNPTIGDEWRRGWHPERIGPAKSEKSVLIVGGGPAGLECARALGQRGYRVTLAESEKRLGGRVTLEAELPCLREWLRVRDWRVTQIGKMPNVDVYLSSELSAEDILEFEADQVVLATGSSWRKDGIGRASHRPLPLSSLMPLYTPDDIMRGRCPPPGDVLVYDDDHYYMGAVIAEKLAYEGAQVTLVTPAADISAFTLNTLENIRTVRRLQGLGVRMVTHTGLNGTDGDKATLYDVRTGVETILDTDAVVLVTARQPHGGLFAELSDMSGGPAVSRIGDCEAPAAIFQAVWSGRRFAEEFEVGATFRRERIDLAPSSSFDLVP
ncbi:FAD-dependent oxidoreductase [Paracoccus saliphilus]|uniref:Dimethylamine/trimethylamine dehydrogenase n=1 Tax=Paracoccus saliphilus TaxID=405559 RepID=A0AA45W2Q9_9RHOB|nr:FAD-dependent oxidoreductase [Paracoccus saliphilus]WCR01403.1 FAD-dependent oxidoreductase [Paracoccus saliphilus]SIS69938.1 dimethylamine/trimethylamine dehydrogenase [Paracoccus saliphilus]